MAIEKNLYVETRRISGIEGDVRIYGKELPGRYMEYFVSKGGVLFYHRKVPIPYLISPKSFLDDVESGLIVRPQEFLGNFY